MAKIKVLLLIAFAFAAQILRAQPELTIQGTTPKLYLTHTVAAKETWFSIGKLYNVTPKELSLFNATTVAGKLSVGQSLKVPLVATNFSQDGKGAPNEVYVPLHYVVQEKEWMYRISQNHNKVPIPSIEKWNGVTNDQLRPGMVLVVGFLKVKQGQSALAAKGTKKLPTGPAQPVVIKDEVIAKKDVEPVKEDPKMVYPKKEEKKEVAVNPNMTKEEPVAKTVEPVKTNPQPAPEPPAATTAVSNTETYNGFRGGYFKNSFAENGKNATGNAGIFRSTSGWRDGKYYALMNNVPAGTIVKVTFPSTNKSVYAKVLGQLPDMRESMGLTLRISDAAAAELGAEIGKFYVDVKY